MAIIYIAGPWDFLAGLFPEQGVFFLALGEQLLAHLIFAWSLTSVLPIMWAPRQSWCGSYGPNLMLEIARYKKPSKSQPHHPKWWWIHYNKGWEPKQPFAPWVIKKKKKTDKRPDRKSFFCNWGCCFNWKVLLTQLPGRSECNNTAGLLQICK